MAANELFPLFPFLLFFIWFKITAPDMNKVILLCGNNKNCTDPYCGCLLQTSL